MIRDLLLTELAASAHLLHVLSLRSGLSGNHLPAALLFDFRGILGNGIAFHVVVANAKHATQGPHKNSSLDTGVINEPHSTDKDNSFDRNNSRTIIAFLACEKRTHASIA